MKSRIVVMLFALAFCLSLAANAQLNSPEGIVLDSSDNLWVANGGLNQVLALNPRTGKIRNTITDGVNGPARLQIVGADLWVLNGVGNNITVYTDLDKPGAELIQTISNGDKIVRSLEQWLTLTVTFIFRAAKATMSSPPTSMAA